MLSRVILTYSLHFLKQNKTNKQKQTFHTILILNAHLYPINSHLIKSSPALQCSLCYSHVKMTFNYQIQHRCTHKHTLTELGHPHRGNFEIDLHVCMCEAGIRLIKSPEVILWLHHRPHSLEVCYLPQSHTHTHTHASSQLTSTQVLIFMALWL